jgi:hypothetical protein
LLGLGKYVCPVQKVIEANAEIMIASQKAAANTGTIREWRGEGSIHGRCLPRNPDNATKTAVREAVETLSGVHLDESTGGLKTDERMAFGVRMHRICISPKNAVLYPYIS